MFQTDCNPDKTFNTWNKHIYMSVFFCHTKKKAETNINCHTYKMGSNTNVMGQKSKNTHIRYNHLPFDGKWQADGSEPVGIHRWTLIPNTSYLDASIESSWFTISSTSNHIYFLTLNTKKNVFSQLQMLPEEPLQSCTRAVPFRRLPGPVCEDHGVPRQHRRVWAQRTGKFASTHVPNTLTQSTYIMPKNLIIIVKK